MMLVGFILYESLNKETDESVFSGEFQLNTCRWICAILLHLNIVEEVYCGLELMTYSYQNWNKFNEGRILYPFLIGFMKFMGGFATEIVSWLIIV